ncbi:OPT oligopeptide transporter protein-domain-containing protein [Zopfochytrium polystomum]|nr:OPT oligopeptide transporter protein-domain-containing protein [Zopfochytrium polystomum]
MSAEPKILNEPELELAVESKIEQEKIGEFDPEVAEYIDEIYDIVDAVVSRTDDPTLPALTLRVWILGIFFGFLLSMVNTLFTFRTNTLTVNPFVAVLLAYPLGLGMSATFPKVSVLGIPLNPGKFNFKEHAIIYVFASTCTQPAYALYNIIGQRYQLYQDDLSVAACVFFGIVTQCFGYGLAGLCRRYLVRPAAMLWPSNLSTIAMLNSLHQQDVDPALPLSRFNFFWIVTAAVFCWEWVPGLMAPLFTAVTILCYVAPNTGDRGQMMRMLGSAYNGMGILSFSFDWSLMTLLAPITTPLWAILNQVLGLWLFLWVLTPILWVHNAFGIDFTLGSLPQDGANGSGLFPLGQALNTGALFTKDGARIAAKAFVNTADLSLKEDVYNASAPIYITTYFALLYMSSFIVFAACLVHVGLWYGKDVWHRFRSSMRDLDTADIHAKMMDVYPEVPDLWYVILLCINLIVGIAVCQWGGFQLPWWGVLLGFLLALVSMIPIGTIQAISGQQIGLNVMSEFLIGLILPGRIAAVMAFKTFSYMAMSQGLLLVSDLKLGHYIKIPPRAMFTVQLFATVMAVIVNIFTSFFIYEHFGRVNIPVDATDPTGPTQTVWALQSPHPPVGWNANGYNVFLNAGAIWGAIGPSRFFGPGSPYSTTLYGFLIGAVLPVVPWLMHRFFPDGYWHLVNIPVIMTVPLDPGTVLSILITPLLVGVVVNYVIKKYHHAWWKKYAYVMSAAFDCGTAIALTVIFFIFVFSDTAPKMPRYALNRYDPELCAPDFYQTCNERAQSSTYDPSTDPDCMYFGLAG